MNQTVFQRNRHAYLCHASNQSQLPRVRGSLPKPHWPICSARPRAPVCSRRTARPVQICRDSAIKARGHGPGDSQSLETVKVTESGTAEEGSTYLDLFLVLNGANQADHIGQHNPVCQFALRTAVVSGRVKVSVTKGTYPISPMS